MIILSIIKISQTASYDMLTFNKTDVGPIAFNGNYLYFIGLNPNQNDDNNIDKDVQIGAIDMNTWTLVKVQNVGRSVKAAGIPFKAYYDSGFLYVCTMSVLLGDNEVGLTKYRVSTPFNVEYIGQFISESISCIFDKDPSTGKKMAFMLTKRRGLACVNLDTMKGEGGPGGYCVGWGFPNYWLRDAVADTIHRTPVYGYYYFLDSVGIPKLVRFDLTASKFDENFLKLPNLVSSMVIDEDTSIIFVGDSLEPIVWVIRNMKIENTININTNYPNGKVISGYITNLIIYKRTNSLYVCYSIVVKMDSSTIVVAAISKIDLATYNPSAPPYFFPAGDYGVISELGKYGSNSYKISGGDPTNYGYMPAIGTYPPGTGTIVRTRLDNW